MAFEVVLGFHIFYYSKFVKSKAQLTFKTTQSRPKSKVTEAQVVTSGPIRSHWLEVVLTGVFEMVWAAQAEFINWYFFHFITRTGDKCYKFYLPRSSFGQNVKLTKLIWLKRRKKLFDEEAKFEDFSKFCPVALISVSNIFSSFWISLLISTGSIFLRYFLKVA